MAKSRRTASGKNAAADGSERKLAFGPDGSHWADDMAVCYGLVRAAKTILANDKLRLEMTDDVPNAHTDGTVVFVPRRHPQRRIATKHELSHIYFKSNLRLRYLFVIELIDVIEAGQPSRSRLSPGGRQALINGICFFINILDDIRVNSLWGLLYPGDGAQMEEWYYGVIGPEMMARVEKEYGGDVEDLFTYAILIALRQQPHSTEWGEFRAEIEAAVNNVHYKTFNAALLLTKQLLLKITRRVVEKQQEAEESQPPPWGGNASPLSADDEDAQQALASAGSNGDLTENEDYDELMKQRVPETSAATSALQKMLGPDGQGPRPQLNNQNAGFDFQRQTVPSAEDRYNQRAVSTLHRIDVEDADALDAALAQAEESGVESVEVVRQRAEELLEGPAAMGNFENEGEMLRKGIRAKVFFHRIEASKIVPVMLTQDDLDTARQWRHLFLRINGTLARRTSAVGQELLTDLYVQRKLSGEPLDYYREETTSRGFRLIVLVDMSGSMANVFPQVEKLAVILRKALDFPFVKLDVMGFSSVAQGTVDIYRFPKRFEGLTSPDSYATGLTPLSQALTIAGRSLIGSRDEKHVFVLSDGFPVFYTNAGKEVATQALQRWTRDAVLDLRTSSVRVWCFMIGSSVPSDEAMNAMFGQRFWRKIDASQVYPDSFAFLRTQFIRFLRSR